ncbi:MAG: hypothetical protein K5651_04375 [Bacteroidales bacterium]|nr:hypothetical protein [Bacteroidales bacterium]
MILEEYQRLLPGLKRLQEWAFSRVKDAIGRVGLMVTACESRVKTEDSLAKKLEIKGAKYAFLTDVTDLVGIRVITLYSADVDKIAALVESIFTVDWDNSVDKRRSHSLDSFGYNSLHYVCRIPAGSYVDAEYPEMADIRFEVQMRTTLQHIWAAIYHDTGYKSDVEVPKEYLRSLNRLAGMLELADDEFSRIRIAINDYRRKVQRMVSSGHFEDVPLDGDSFRSYLTLRPFDSLNRSIAAINQAEIHEISLFPYLEVLRYIGCKTLGDVEQLLKDYREEAYRLAVYQIGGTDIDILTSSIGLQSLCNVAILRKGGGVNEMEKMYDILSGPSAYNRQRAERAEGQARLLGIKSESDGK